MYPVWWFFLCLFVSTFQILAMLVPVALYRKQFRSRVIIGSMKWSNESMNARDDGENLRIALVRLRKCHRLLFFFFFFSLHSSHWMHETVALTIWEQYCASHTNDPFYLFISFSMQSWFVGSIFGRWFLFGVNFSYACEHCDCFIAFCYFNVISPINVLLKV